MSTRALATFVFVLALAGLCASSAMAAFPGTNGRIAFGSDRDGDYEIYSMAADGTGQTNLTNHPARDTGPALSPNGQKVVFTSDRDPDGINYTEIYVMDANGFHQTRLTTATGYDYTATFSPDGQKIVFASSRRDTVSNRTEIYVMNANGTNPTPLTSSASGDSDVSPVFSPDGQKIAFERSHNDGQAEIWVMNANGTGQTNLTNNAASDSQPAFSPDGQKIVFESTRDSGTGGGPYEIYSMNANGSGQTNLTHNAAGDTEAAFSPDGKRIAFTSNRGGSYAVWAMDPSGANPVNLTRNTGFTDSSADWGSCGALGGCAGPPPSPRGIVSETRRASCEVSPFQAIDNGRGTGDLDTTCEIYFGERPTCQVFKVCQYRPDDACPLGAICVLQTTATWTQVERRYLAVAYANSRLEQTSPPLTVSGRFSHSCVTVTNCSSSDTQQAFGRAPMVSTCSALVSPPRGAPYVQVPPRFKPQVSAAAASLKLSCRATLKIRPAPPYTLFPTAGKLVTFLPAAGRVTVTPLSGKASAAKKRKKRPALPFRSIGKSATGAGVVILTPKLSATAKRALKRKGRLRVKVRVLFTPKLGGPKVKRTQTLTLKPAAKRPASCRRHKGRAKRPKTCVPKQLR